MFGKDEKTLQELLKSFAKQDKFKNKLSQVQIADAWKELMGDSINSYTYKIEFYDGVLTIFLTNASLKQELLYGREQILRNLNHYLKGAIIKSVVIK